MFQKFFSKKSVYTVIFLCLISFTMVGCGGGGRDTPGEGDTPGTGQSTTKAITAFSLDGVAGVVNETAKTIGVTMPFGTDVTALIATFTTSGASVHAGGINQTSGATANDFTNPVICVVTAADGSTVSYTVTVTVASGSAKAITLFSLNGVAGVINEAGKTIAVTMPNGTDVTALAAFFLTTGANVHPAPGENDFTNPVVYTVTAADGATASYTVTVTVAVNSAKAITAFSLNGVPGTINEAGKTIAVTLPAGTDVTALVATFTTTGLSVHVGVAIQTSGATANNFLNPVVYTVTAADGTTAGYTVTVTVATSAALSKIPDTDQTASYTDTFGEDSNYTINPPSYTNNGNGTVTDNVTGLMWQREEDDNIYNWYRAAGVAHATYNPGGAADVCGSLSLGGYSDWRLPTVQELPTILDLGLFSPAIDTLNFPGTNSSSYWSATTYVDFPSYAWIVNFGPGYVFYNNKTLSHYVRCVRGGQ